ncbi:MAG: hypothetical protein A2776_00005 [Candidatus Levybacteria bacterium RIFCSPHIGHO2_01_FULL_40_10]|nr:MAG: hypothetical protein A2776_00005 [Candidatus Levybacteria bacterium RIFCSPHIGHO2_01_FULL_40_10]
MEFRELTIEDYSRLIPFWKDNYFVNEHDTKERLKLFLEKNPGLSVLAEDDGKIAATALGSYDGRRGYLQKVVVDKKFRRHGLGLELVKKVLDKLKDVGVTYIPLSVEEDLVEFYEKCGFKKTKQVPMNIDF